MYAIIRTGGKQAKVHSGDVLEIERVKDGSDKLTFAPLLVVDDKGTAVSDPKVLGKAKVTAKVLGETKGDKIDIFKYKNKTGYRRRQGHRQTYTQIEITGITLPAAAKPKSESKPAAKTATAEKPKAEPKATAKPKTTAAAKPKAEPKAEAKPAAAAKPKTEPKTAAKPKTPAKPKTAPAPSTEE